MQQVTQPDLTTKGSVGMCLLYARNVFSAPWAGPDAWSGWTSHVKYKHTDALPKGVYVPIWFDGYWEGKRQGHVAVYKDGKVWSSPYKSGQNFAVLDSIAEVERRYKMKYVGWSEDIGGKIIVKGGDMPKIGSEANWRWRFNRLHRQLVGNWDMSDATFNAIVGQDAWSVVENWSDHPSANTTLNYQVVGERAVKDKWDQQIYNLQDQVKALSSRPTKAELDAVKKQAEDLAKSADEAKKQVEELKKKQSEDSILLDEAGSWLQKLWNRLFKKG